MEKVLWGTQRLTIAAKVALQRAHNRPAVFRNISRSLCSARDDNPQNLPALPLPPLHQTIDTFLKSARPHLSAEDFRTTESAARVFEQNEGRRLHKLLEAKAATEINWLADYWLSAAYLKFRSPVTVYSSPGEVFPLRQFSTELQRLEYAAKVIRATLKFKELVDTERIPLETMGKIPLDMRQYKMVFGTCRIPGVVEDQLQFNGTSKHIIVTKDNCFYKVQVYGGKSGNQILSENEIVSQLAKCTGNKMEAAVGILSSDNRDNWGQAYQVLMEDALNRKSVETIQKSLFLMCLDKAVDNGGDPKTMAGELCMHGFGSQGNAGNRWYDKTVQFIIAENGLNGLTYEHAPAEGVSIAVLTDAIVKYVDQRNGEHGPDVGIPEQPECLEFTVTDRLKALIKKSSDNVDKLANDTDALVLHFQAYGKEFIKTQKMSPDSYIQMAMQYAFHKLHGFPGGHYETAQTRMFAKGRTETIRSCSIESVEFAKAMDDASVPDIEKVKRLRAAVEAHKNYTVMAIKGHGVDRHFLGLKLIAAEHNLPTSQFFSDPGYQRSAYMHLGTSQVATNCEGFMIYGPVVQDGYGCCYNPRANDMLFAVVSFKSESASDTRAYRDTLSKCLRNMYDVLVRAGGPQKSKL